METKHSKQDIIEVGLDETGRGPAFGRVYAAAVIWPPDLTSELIRDSKTIKSVKSMKNAYDFIKTNAIAVTVAYASEQEIDTLNILQADMLAMHRALDALRIEFDEIIVDGNYFKPYKSFKYTTIVKGDAKYYSIAAASIVAKYERDLYISHLCDVYPDLDEKYDLLKNKGYPTPAHLAGITTHGISPYHRKTFKCCKMK
jgi:ribonuclease HII